MAERIMIPPTTMSRFGISPRSMTARESILPVVDFRPFGFECSGQENQRGL
ncbi:MAG: hypothetical protein RBQ72_11845 [Desulfobacterium sp.]|nr:hypothetical protein [Desulfobacterium sp.]